MHCSTRWVFLILFVLLGVSPAWADADLRSAEDRRAAEMKKALVVVKLTSKVRYKQREMDRSNDTVGTVIDPSGLTMVSAYTVNPVPSVSSTSDDESSRMDVSLTSVILLLEDGTEIPSDVVFRDADLDFAFIRPREASRTFDSIQLQPHTQPIQMFDKFFTFSRLGPKENYALAAYEGIIRSVVKGPRTYYVCEDAHIGSLAFSTNGSILGVFVSKPSQRRGSSQASSVAIMRPIEDLIESAAQAKQAKAPAKEVTKVEPESPSGEAAKKDAATPKPEQTSEVR
jgi:hypothetical protein